MPFSITDPEGDRLVRELATRTGESLEDAVVTSLRERLNRVNRQQRWGPLLAELRAIRHRTAALPVLDARTPEEIVGYDREGLVT